MKATHPFRPLESLDELERIAAASASRPQVLFKHSTRCSISAMALSRMTQGANHLADKADVYVLDLIRYREVSNAIAERFQVHHESPQLLLIEQGDCTLEQSHLEIDPRAVAGQIG
ncbi:MAG: bacillithiol system redox-active protein YtxJ [Bacteroidia bacterium]|nr:bacillithiol system redox-active protein YtxJ [Bacteroidia bacterium]